MEKNSTTSSDKLTLSIDIETYSSVDLRKSGVYKYTEASDFQVLMIAFAYGTDAVHIADLSKPDGNLYPPEYAKLLDDLLNPQIIKSAFNANFERVCLSKMLGVELPPEQWRCTMVHALELGLPGSLDEVAKALGIEQQKDKNGKRLIRKYCMPDRWGKQQLPSDELIDTDWQAFKEYCMQDVRVEMAIRQKLAQFPLVDDEWRLWAIDQRINDRGIAIDPVLVVNAVNINDIHNDILETEAIKITGISNPNSVSQLKDWFKEAESIEIDDLKKQTVPELLKEVKTDAARRMLEIRQEMSKTSVKKFNAMWEGKCQDDRVRGLLQFYGAGRTGRWAGRLVQVQNLPGNKMADLDQARAVIRAGDYETAELLYDNVPDVLSQLIRTAFVPRPGHRFIVADFSAIEARVIAWLAGEQWRLDVFETHGKIYEASAAQMFNVPLESIGKGSPLRQKGKVAELACIAENELVLTQLGLVPIQNITREHLLWDGIEWVQHEGLIERGLKEVITYDGLTATHDHLVFIEGQQKPIQFGDAAANSSHLAQTGIGRFAIRMGKNHQRRTSLRKSGLDISTGFNKMHGMRVHTMDVFFKSDKREIKRLSVMLETEKGSSMVGETIHGCKATLHKSKRQRFQKLRRARNRVSFSIHIRGLSVDDGASWFTGQKHANRQNRREWSLRTRQCPMGGCVCEQNQSTQNSLADLEPKGMAVCKNSSAAETSGRIDARTNHQRRGDSGFRETEKLEGYRGKVKVYDILNAGPRNRFTVSGKLVHNCGYGGGVQALKNMGADKMGLDDSELQDIITAWRSANPAIVKLWRNVENCFSDAIRTSPAVVHTLLNKLQFQVTKNIAFIKLPSGRKLAYVKPELQPHRRFEGKEEITYMGVDQITRKWSRLGTYSGKIVENLCQAIARDCLAESLMRLHDAGLNVVMHVHDEVVLEVPIGESSAEQVAEIMGESIAWAPGLPLRADAFETDYYRKD